MQPGLNRPALAVVIPVANEERQISELLERVARQLGPTDLIHAVIDNKSEDRTRAIMDEFAERDPRLVVVWAPENRSVVDAYFRGYREALASDAQWILEMDAGLSHEPEQIPRFLEAMASGVDFAAGSRFIKGGRYIGVGRRWLISRGGTQLANLLLKTRMRDMTSGFECFTREALQHVVDRGVRSRAHFFQTEIRVMLHDWNWVEVPITYSDPSPSVTAGSLGEALRILRDLRTERRAARPQTAVR